MKAFLLTAALAAVPMAANAVVVSVPNELGHPEYYAGSASYTSSGGTISYVFHIEDDLVNTILELSATGGNGTLSYSLLGAAAVFVTTPYSGTFSLGALSAGDYVVTYVYTAPTSGRVMSVSTTATLYGDVAAVPVPAAGLMALAGVVSLGAVRKRRQKA